MTVKKRGSKRVKIYDHPNPEIKSFLTQVEISAPRVEKFRTPLKKDREADLNGLGAIGAQIVRDIMKVPGVQEIHMKPKEIRMKKELSSSWQDIEEKILEILERALRKKDMRVVGRQSPIGR